MDKERETIYYLIRGKLVGRRAWEDGHVRDCLFRDGRWEPDDHALIMGHLLGFDPYEPEGSPYRFGCLDRMDEIERIPEKQASERVNGQVLTNLRALWKEKFRERKTAWDEAPGWPSKLVKTECLLNGLPVEIWPEDIGVTSDCWDQGFMETVQNEVEADLAAAGATKIYSFGYID